jgi:hypothetical protein
MSTPVTPAAQSSSPASAAPTSSEAIIAQAALPQDIALLVRAVIKRAKLWRSERTDVTRELCAHFADALSTGAPVHKLISDFGDPRRAAALIHRAKRQNRPPWYKACRLAIQSIAATFLLAVVLYLFFAAQVLLSRPNIARNFSAEFNAAVAATPESRRAWPLYLDAIRKFGVRPEYIDRGEVPFTPGDPHWDEHVPWLRSHAAALDTVRAAASRPILGRLLTPDIGDDLDQAMRDAGRPVGARPNFPPVENPLMIGVLLPHLGELRHNARLIASDCSLAILDTDPARYRANIRALLGMSHQCLGESFLITQLVGVAIAHVAFERLLAADLSPGFLTDADLRDLSHELAGFEGGRIQIRFEGERYGVEDMLQRYFSDNGRGDGYYIGGEQIDALYDDFGMARPKALPLLHALTPVQSAIVPSRAQIQNLLERFLETAQRDEALPPWRHHERISPLWWSRLMESGVYNLFPPLRSLLGDEPSPAVASLGSRDMVEAYRSAILVRFASELHRRRHGSWPASLDQLVPAFLPSLPVDPITGQPLHYALQSASGMPLLYSVGVDGIDNGGTPPPQASSPQEVRNFSWISYFRVERGLSPGPMAVDGGLPPLTGAQITRMSSARGDWILWKE